MSRSLLENRFNEAKFTKFINSFLPDFQPSDLRAEERKGFKSIEQLGESASLDLGVFVAEPDASIHSRMEISRNSYAFLKTHPRAHALVAYRKGGLDEWRLSLITTQVSRSESGIKETVSNPRRYSYVLGPDAKINTPTRYLVSRGPVSDFNDLRERFSLDVVNKDFYKGIARLFSELTGADIGNEEREGPIPLIRLPDIPDGNQRVLEFTVRLIGRIIFCWFLREKKSSSGVPLMPREILSVQAADGQTDFYHTILEPIFFEVLNKNLKDRIDAYATGSFAQIPYLNGGLFSPSPDDYFSYNEEKKKELSKSVVIPDSWIHELLSFLETYNFTIDENVSFDEELSIDPEMLGRIFENLLAEINPETGESARKSTGSYYTPRSIVDHMVDESLCNYLIGSTQLDDPKIRALISYDLEDDLESPLTDDERQKVIDSLENLRILDPACGSGAFPIGALHKIVFILQQVDPNGRNWFEKQIENTSPEMKRALEREFSSKNFDYIRKLGVIRENIFGVDIQPIATEISRLRCFLTLIVDQGVHDEIDNRGIEPLPNLDFKFVAANALIGLADHKGPSVFQDKKRIAELKELRGQFFTATNNERSQLKLDFKELQKEMLDHQIELGGSDATTRILSKWDPFSHRATQWFDPSWMFGIEDGFDIVIGNPPYLESRHPSFSSESKEMLQEAVRSRWQDDSQYITKGSDLLIYFYERGIDLITENGYLVYIVQNSWLDTDYGKKFQRFLLKHTNVKSVADSDLKHFEGPNINTVITVFRGKVAEPDNVVVFSRFGTEYTELHRLSYSSPLLTEIKWGILLVASREVLELLATVRRHGKLIDEMGLSIGQGLNISKKAVVDGGISDRFPFLAGKLLPFMASGAPFELTETPNFLIDGAELDPDDLKLLRAKGIEVFDRRSTQKVPPILILPRGVSRHFCALNSVEAYTASAVEVYDNGTDEETRMNLWCFLNSSVAWLLREVSGRKNLGGGLLKAEATDLKSIPIYFDFCALEEIKMILERIRDREAKPTLKEIETDEHKAIDDIVFKHLDIPQDKRSGLIDELRQIVSRRSKKAKT